MSDQALLASWDKLMRVVEAPYADAVEHEKNRYIDASSKDFPSSRTLTDALFLEHVAFMGLIAEKYQGIAIRLALKEALSTPVKAAGIICTKEDWDTLWLYLVRLWVTRYGAQRAKAASQTTRDDMQRIIDQALGPAVEFNPMQVATDLLAAKQLSRPRAEVIARTEVHGAMMFASQEGAAKLSRDEGLTLLKRWVPVLDERTRISHGQMGSVPPIHMDADFTVGGERMSRPGDPRGSAGNVINCRCVLAYQVENS